MMNPKKILKPVIEVIHSHGRGVQLGIFLGAGAMTGLASVAFMWAFEFVLEHQLNMARIGAWIWIAAPLIFVLSVELIRRAAPYADGAGIPQTVFAATHLTEASLTRLRPLVSFRTMAIKVIALLLAVWVGASAGREGPTVHVAACLFLGIVLIVRRFTKLKMDLRSAVIAGGAAGLAAAFNTPLAGVTFAIEELSQDYFSSIKESVLMAIILAGIAAKTLIGEYAYFGRLAAPASVSMTTVLMIGIAGGIRNQNGESLTDSGWERDCNRAILFAPQQAEATIKVLSEKSTSAPVTAFYVIQNEKFNYYDGDRDWVCNIADAKFYVTAKEAEKKIKNL